MKVISLGKSVLLWSLTAGTLLSPVLGMAGENYTCTFKQNPKERSAVVRGVTDSLRQMKSLRDDSELLKFSLSQLASQAALMDLLRIGADVDFELDDDRRLTVDLIYSGPGIGDRHGVESSTAVKALFSNKDECEGAACLANPLRESAEFKRIEGLIDSGKGASLKQGEVEALARVMTNLMRRKAAGEQTIRIESSGTRVVVGANEDEHAHAKESLDVTGAFVVAGMTEHGRIVVRNGRQAALGDLSGSCQQR